MSTRKLHLPLALACCAVPVFCWLAFAGTQHFQCTDASASIDVPVSGNPTFYLNDYLANQSDHMVVGKRVAGSQTSFIFKREIINTCDSADYPYGTPHGSGLAIGDSLQVWCYDFGVTSQLNRTGGFATNAYTFFKGCVGDQLPTLVAQDTHPFTVIQ